MTKSNDAAKEKLQCIHPECDHDARSRGLCPACYQTAYRMVRDGTTTWQTLEDAGKVLPPSRNQRSAEHRGWFSKVQV